MNAVAERRQAAPRTVPGRPRTNPMTWTVASNRARRRRIVRVMRRRFARTLLAPARTGLKRASDSVASAIIAAILLAFSLAFAALMIVAILVALTCGLACYA